MYTEAESPEVDRFTVQLKKDENGLGITIAGEWALPLIYNILLFAKWSKFNFNLISVNIMMCGYLITNAYFF